MRTKRPFATIYIVQESVDRLHLLFDLTAKPVPFMGRDDPRDVVEGNQPLFGLGTAIDVEGDPGEAEQLFGFTLFGPQPLWVLAIQPVVELPVRRRKSASLPHISSMVELQPITWSRRQSAAVAYPAAATLVNVLKQPAQTADPLRPAQQFGSGWLPGGGFQSRPWHQKPQFRPIVANI